MCLWDFKITPIGAISPKHSFLKCNLASPINHRRKGHLQRTLETRVVDDAGRDQPPGEVGELWVKGAQVIKGYLNRPEATAETLADGWLRTGDIARVDAEGFIYIVDRAKDMLLLKTLSLSPFQEYVEHPLLEAF